MRFEIGKTYKFDKEKFMEINGVLKLNKVGGIRDDNN